MRTAQDTAQRAAHRLTRGQTELAALETTKAEAESRLERLFRCDVGGGAPGTQDDMGAPQRSVESRVGGAEEGEHRASNTPGQMHRSGIGANE